MHRVLKHIQYYILMFGLLVVCVIASPYGYENLEKRRDKQFQVIDNQDSTYTIIHNDTAYDALYQDEIDSMINTLKH